MKLLVITLAFALSAHAQYAWFTTGEQRTIVAVIGLGSQPTTTDVERARQAVFGIDSSSVDQFVRAASDRQAWVTGDAIGVMIPADSSCSVWGWTMQAADDAVGKRVNLALYVRRIYILLGNSGCTNFAGISTRGVAFRFGEKLYSLSWIVGFQSAFIFHHEYMHGLGMAHAGLFNPLDGNGDPSDLMGGAADRTLNGPNKEKLAWIHPSQIQTITDSGTYTVSSLESETDGFKLIKIRRPVGDWGTTNPEYLVISRRQALGVYNAGMVVGLTRGVALHVVQDTAPGPIYTHLVDTTPGSALGFFDSALWDGGTWYDAKNRILVKQNSHTDTVAMVNVQFNADAPTPVPPPPIPPPPPPVCTPIGKSGKVKCR